MASNQEISQKYYMYAKKIHDELHKNSQTVPFKSKSAFYNALTKSINKKVDEKYTDSNLRKEATDKIWKQLENSSDMPEKNPIFSADGKLNVTVLTSVINKANNTINMNYEGKNDLEESKNTNNRLQELSEQEKNKQLKKVFETYTQLESFEEKRDFFSENFYDIGDLAEDEQKQVLDAYEKGNEIEQLYEKIEIENPDLSREKLDNLKRQAIEEKAENENLSVEYLEKCEQYNELLKNIKMISDADLKKEYINQAEELRIELGISEKRQDEIIYEEETDFTNESGLDNGEEVSEQTTLDNQENDFFMDELLDTPLETEEYDIENQQEDFFMGDLSDIELDNEEEFEQQDKENVSEEINDNIEIEEKNQFNINTKVNPIIANVPEEDFVQEYTKEIKENPILKFFKDLQKRFTQRKLTEGRIEKSDDLKQQNYTQEVKISFFDRVKKAISKLIHKNKNDILAIDTVENNTKTVDFSSKGSWDLSQYGTSREEVNKNTIIATNQLKQDKKKSEKSTEIEADGESLSI